MAEIEEIVDLEQFAALAPEWDDLVARSGCDSVFASHAWLSAWWLHLAVKRRPWVLVHRQGGQLEAAAPLILGEKRRRGVALRTLRFLSGGISDRLAILATANPRENCARFAQHLAKRRDLWDELDLCDLTHEGGLGGDLAQELSRSGLEAGWSPELECPFVEIGSDWEAFYHAQIGSKTRSNNRNKTKKLGKLGELRYRWVLDVRDDPAALEAVFGLVERDSQHGVERHRPFDSAPGRRFFEDVLRRFSEKGWLFLALMELDDRLIAYRLCFRFRGVHSDYFHGFDPELANLSPGRLLMTQTLEDCFENGLREVDFLRGFEEWKREWTDRSRWNGAIRLRNPSLLSTARRFLHSPRDVLGR